MRFQRFPAFTLRAFRLPMKSAGMEKFPWWLGHAMLSGRFRRERFAAGPRRGGKGVIPRARSRRWADFIAIFICHGEEANGIYLHGVYRCAKTKVWMAFTVYRLWRCYRSLNAPLRHVFAGRGPLCSTFCLHKHVWQGFNIKINCDKNPPKCRYLAYVLLPVPFQFKK